MEIIHKEFTVIIAVDTYDSEVAESKESPEDVVNIIRGGLEGQIPTEYIQEFIRELVTSGVSDDWIGVITVKLISK